MSEEVKSPGEHFSAQDHSEAVTAYAYALGLVQGHRLEGLIVEVRVMKL
jgi:hypothetical protein